jgi:hypothetical protein
MTLCGVGSEYHWVGKGVAMFFQFRRPSKHEQAAGKCPTILTFQTKLMSVIGTSEKWPNVRHESVVRGLTEVWRTMLEDRL